MTRYILPVILALLWPYLALAQQVLPPANTAALVCAFNTSPPTITTNNFAYVQCDANGKLLTTAPAGTLVLAGSSGDFQTNNGSGNLGAVTPGTGVAAAFAINTSSAGSFLINGGVLGTPSSGTLTNTTGLPIATGVSGLGSGVATAAAAATNATGGLTTQNGAIVTGNLVTKSSTGIQDSGLAPTMRVTIAQSRIPMILPSSGSMANNGALTLTTALDQAYPAAYFYMPLGAIVAASPAGYYYGTMSSTTAVTLFNNLYVSGSPTIPGSPTAFATTGPGAYTQTTGTALNAHLFLLPGGTLGINDEVQAHGLVSYNNTAGVKTIALTYGGTFTYGSAGPTTTASLSFQGGFANAGIATRQNQTGLSALTVGAVSGTVINGAINSASSQNLVASLKIATATDYIILQSYSAERIIAANN